MAVESNVFSSKMQLRYNYGVDEKGNPMIKAKTYANVTSEATDQAIYDVAAAIATLQSNTLEEVHKIQDVMLVNV